jgi:excisionase family DNA binding protein
MNEHEPLMTIEQAANRLGLSTATLYRWSQAGRFPFIRISPRALRFESAAVEAFIEARKEGPAA